MRYFVAALKHGSISAASEELHVSASAIAAAIDQIEDHLQVTLVTRQRSRGIAGTASGRVMARKFRSLLEDYDAMMQDGAELTQSFRGQLRIGYYSPVAPAFLPEILSSLLAPEHDLTIHLEACDNAVAQRGLKNGDFDVILFVPEGPDNDMETVALVKAPAYCLLPSKHELAQYETLALDRLVDERIAILDRPFVADYYRRLFEMTNMPPRVIAHCNSTEMIRSLVGRGEACALLNMLPLTSTSYAGDQLVAKPITDDLPALTLAVGYLRRPRRVVQEFVKQCQDYPWDTIGVICPSALTPS